MNILMLWNHKSGNLEIRVGLRGGTKLKKAVDIHNSYVCDDDKVDGGGYKEDAALGRRSMNFFYYCDFNIG